MKFPIIILILLALVSCKQTKENEVSSPPALKELRLTFGVYTTDKPTDVVAQFRPLLNRLEQKLTADLEQDVKIKIDITASYQAAIKNIAEGRADFARFGPASYILAKQQNEEIQIIAIESNKGKKTFQGVIVVHQDSPIQSLAELKNKSFAFGNEKSTIGRYLAQELLLENGIKCSDLISYDYLGRHDAVGSAVGARRFDAGALKEGTFKKLVAKGTPIRVLSSFKNVTKPWITHSEISPSVLEALRKALLSIEDGEALEALGKQGFLKGSDSDYSIIRQSMLNNAAFMGKE
ncbi:MAG: PhnD/SsuA/transferrin family substrate-binding protein [Rubritalea sp.]|uniref:PhnD/SsuA/transferrin family substrate-binding protein n=1 Tax=Rubritalea sp. TaxID=2109375 RepID=UPI0032428EBF